MRINPDLVSRAAVVAGLAGSLLAGGGGSFAEATSLATPQGQDVLRGRVIDRETGEPIPGARVRLKMPEGKERSPEVVEADERGLFTFPRCSAREEVNVAFEPPEGDERGPWRTDPDGIPYPVPKGFRRMRELGGVKPVVFRVDPAVAVLELCVLDPDGDSADEAWVSFSQRRPLNLDSDGNRDRVAVEGDHIVRALYREDVRHTLFIEASARGGFGRSERLRLDPPFTSGTHVLQLHEAPLVRGSVREEDGSALRATGIVLYALSAGQRHEIAATHASRMGLFTFPRPCPGEYVILAHHEPSRRRAERSLQLAAGARERVDLVLAPSSIRLAAAGLVVDERGSPLGGVAVAAEIGASLRRGEGVRTRSAGDGAFELWARPAAKLILKAGADYDSDSFAPAVQELAFGRRDAVLRRIERSPKRKVGLRVLDADTGQPVRAACVWARSPCGDARRVGRTNGGGVWSETIELNPWTQWRVAAPGYQAQSFTFAHEGHQPDWNRTDVEVALQAGWIADLFVRDARTGRPIEGAGLWRTGVELGRSGADGWIHADFESPSRAGFRVVRGGFRHAALSPDDLCPFGTRVVLEREPREERDSAGDEER